MIEVNIDTNGRAAQLAPFLLLLLCKYLGDDARKSFGPYFRAFLVVLGQIWLFLGQLSLFLGEVGSLLAEI